MFTQGTAWQWNGLQDRLFLESHWSLISDALAVGPQLHVRTIFSQNEKNFWRLQMIFSSLYEHVESVNSIIKAVLYIQMWFYASVAWENCWALVSPPTHSVSIIFICRTPTISDLGVFFIPVSIRFHGCVSPRSIHFRCCASSCFTSRVARNAHPAYMAVV